jgi:hypothetical protein
MYIRNKKALTPEKIEYMLRESAKEYDMIYEDFIIFLSCSAKEIREKSFNEVCESYESKTDKEEAKGWAKSINDFIENESEVIFRKRIEKS